MKSVNVKLYLGNNTLLQTEETVPSDISDLTGGAEIAQKVNSIATMTTQEVHNIVDSVLYPVQAYVLANTEFVLEYIDTSVYGYQMGSSLPFAYANGELIDFVNDNNLNAVFSYNGQTRYIESPMQHSTMLDKDGTETLHYFAGMFYLTDNPSDGSVEFVLIKDCDNIDLMSGGSATYSPGQDLIAFHSTVDVGQITLVSVSE